MEKLAVQDSKRKGKKGRDLDSDDNVDKQLDFVSEHGNVTQGNLFEYKKEAIKLITVNENDSSKKVHLELNEEGLQYLQSLDAHV